MNIEDFRNYCLAKPGVTEELPFGPDTLVYKVLGKAFALTGINSEDFSVNLKCDPERALELRASYDAVQPGYHMNKKHWNTVSFETNELSDKELIELINHSYDLVAAKLTVKQKKELEALGKS